MAKKQKFPFGSNFIKKENAKMWAEKSGEKYRVVKRKAGYTVRKAR